MLALWPYNSICGDMDAEKPLGSSIYLHIRTVRSNPEEAICVEEMNFASLIEEVCPPFAAEGDVANTSDDMFHTRSKPS